MASSQAVLASSGASFANFANLTSSLLKLPPSLQTYLDGAFDHISGATEYLQSATGLSPTALYTTVGAILVLGTFPTVVRRSTQDQAKSGRRKGGIMSRYGWSSRTELSPYNSTLGSGSGVVPAVTEDDFSYITSEDLENQGLDERRQYQVNPRDSGTHVHRPAAEYPEDDILLIETNKGEFQPARFPAYSIGDGKLLVSDVRDRVKLVMQLSDRRARRVKLLYKGRQLKEPSVPVREYGVKNNSRIMVALGDAGADESSDEGRNDLVIVEHEDTAPKKGKKRRKGKKRASDDSVSNVGSNAGSNAGSNVGSGVSLEVPREDGRRGGSTSRPQSPASAVSGTSAASAVRHGPMAKLESISEYFTTNLLPSCVQFTANPPQDAKKRTDEHRKLSETIMEHVILKLDAVDTEGDDAVRMKRKELVLQIQGVLKGLDASLRS